MGRVNDNNILNVSIGGGDDLLDQDGIRETSLEAYTVVLSAAAHVLSMILGGGSSVIVIIAIITRRNINRYSYTLVLTLFLACCFLNFVWSPLEVADLIMFHYAHKHPCERIVATRTALYLILILFISIIIVLLSAEGIIRTKNCFGRLLRRIWPVASCALALFSSIFLISVFVVKCLQSEHNTNDLFLIMDNHIRSLILALTVLAFCVVLIILSILAVFFIKDTVYWEDWRPHLRQKKLKLEIPEFLISQSNACADNDGGFEDSKSGTPSPSTPKLLTIRDPDTMSIKAEDASNISELPTVAAKPMGNRLGINMAQVLGRRRHTICQISDSSGVASTPTDPISRAKQYNYVRKFSVDISALQAQLQNPKIFRDAPYQSDIDLSKKQPSENARSQVPKPLLPLKPLVGSLDEKEEKTPESEKSGAEIGRVGTSNPPPPVIMVSNDDAPPNSDDDDNIPKEIHSSKDTFHENTKTSIVSSTTVQKPTTLNFNESTEEHVYAQTLESAVSDPSDTESEGRKMARLSLLMSLTFILNMLPVVVTEVLISRLNKHAFTNIYTCTLAVSTIQTIVYPRLIAACDNVVHRAIGKLKRRIKHVFSCCSDTDTQSPVHDSSSTGHL